MGADLVAYHRTTVIERGDDYPGAALANNASRGGTPLVWGGAGAPDLGLADRVSDDECSAMFGVGGAADPGSGRRLVRTRRLCSHLWRSRRHSQSAQPGLVRTEPNCAIGSPDRPPQAPMADFPASALPSGRRTEVRLVSNARDLLDIAVTSGDGFSAPRTAHSANSR